MSADIIELAARQQVKVLRDLAALSNRGCDQPSPGKLFKVHSRSLLALPFVTLPTEECDWREFWKRTSMWNDDPTGVAHVDWSRGRRYAREAITAIISDGASPRNLEMVVDAIIERGFRRRGPGGRICRQLSSAETGFLHELCEIAVETTRQVVSGVKLTGPLDLI
jgi:hypothetical protein